MRPLSMWRGATHPLPLFLILQDRCHSAFSLFSLGVPKHPRGFPLSFLPPPLLPGNISVALFFGGGPSLVLTSDIGVWMGITDKDCSQQTQPLPVTVGNMHISANTRTHRLVQRALRNSEGKEWGESPGNEFISSLEEGMEKRKSWRAGEINPRFPNVIQEGGKEVGGVERAESKVQMALMVGEGDVEVRAQHTATSTVRSPSLGAGAYEEMQND